MPVQWGGADMVSDFDDLLIEGKRADLFRLAFEAPDFHGYRAQLFQVGIQRPMKLCGEGAESLNGGSHDVADTGRIGPCVEHVGDLVEVRALFAHFGPCSFPFACDLRGGGEIRGQGFVVGGRLATTPGQGRIE